MSQLSSFSKIYLVTTRSDVKFYLKNAIGDSMTLEIKNDVSFLDNSNNKIIIFDTSLFDDCSVEQYEEFVTKTKHVIFLLPITVSQPIKTFVEENYKYIVPFPTEKILLRKCIEEMVYDFVSNQQFILPTVLDYYTAKTSLNGFFSGSSQLIKKARTEIDRVAKVDSAVLLLGETGTGKTVCADVIHNLSKRKSKEIASCSVTNIVDTLANSTFFGTEPGAYTDAKETKGLFRQANRSTLFLDEIGLATPTVQGILLNVLSTGVIQKVGSDKAEKVDIRLITATNEELTNLVAQKSFRADLYYRINDNVIKLPSLRDRIEDIPIIANSFLIETNKILTENAIEKLMEYQWPGNIRQLKKCINRAVNLSNRETINAEDLDKVLYDA